jgi:hypothetical protein
MGLERGIRIGKDLAGRHLTSFRNPSIHGAQVF